ncbi:MAG: helix-turn-helix transcriptional regulator [Pirellulales bacterium]|nr:helix-turn-helix transcriptional regulator [Pirellulales bacterium]
MISSSRIEEIRRLLNRRKLSQRAIARQMGVSRGTVQAVARGQRLPQPRRRRAEPWAGFSPPSGLPVRCPGCGAKVQTPCLACYISGIKRQLKNAMDRRS